MKTPRELSLPDKFKNWRFGQGELVESITQSEEKVYLLDAPTGTGKSLIGIGVHKSGYRPDGSLYLTRTKQLQDQILQDFPEAKTIKGRINYPCLKHDKKFPNYTADDCTNSENNPCGYLNSCPYFVAKEVAIRAPLAVLNMSYFLTEANGPARFSGRDLLILDEVDALEGELMNYIQLRITSSQLDKFGLSLPQDRHSIDGWLYWMADLDFGAKIKSASAIFEDIPEDFWTNVEIGASRKVKQLRRLKNKFTSFKYEVDDTWLLSEETNMKETIWTFKPVQINKYADQYLWSHAKSFLGMSGTILSPEIMANDLGIDKWEYTSVDSPFPISHRPIYYIPVVNLTYASMNDELPHLAEAVMHIMEEYENDKILVHTTSFAIRNFILKYLNSKRVITHDSDNREQMLKYFKQSSEPLVMLSPSFDRGVDLKDESCRCVIICKVPYLSLGDPQVKARMKLDNGNIWYSIKAVQTIIQMSGRGVRSEEDYCDTYILDMQFEKLLKRTKSSFPKWWLDAIKTI